MPEGCFGPWVQDANFFDNFLEWDSGCSTEILITYPALFAAFNAAQTWSITLLLGCLWETASWALSWENRCSPLAGSSRRRMSGECRRFFLSASLQLIPSWAFPAPISLFLEIPRAEAPERKSSLVVRVDLAVLSDGHTFYIRASEKWGYAVTISHLE